MKKNLLTAALAFCAAAPLLATEANDTIIDVRNPQRVVVEERDSLMSLTVRGRDGDSTFCYRYTRTFNDSTSAAIVSQGDKWDFNRLSIGRGPRAGKPGLDLSVGLLSFGFATPLGAPAGMHTDMLASGEIMLGPLSLERTTRNGLHCFSFGIAGTWRNYRMNGATRFVKADGRVQTAPYPEGADPDFSRIKVISSNFLFGYTRNLGHDFGLSLYGILNLNGRASIKTRYKLDGRKVKEQCKEIHQRPVTIDVMARASYRWLGVYVKYSPFDVLRTDFGPSFQSLSAGLTLFW